MKLRCGNGSKAGSASRSLALCSPPRWRCTRRSPGLQNTVKGNCGTSTLVGDNDGGGPIVIQGQLITEDLEAITGGKATFIWSWSGGGNSKSWEPRSVKGDPGGWISPQMDFTAPVGAYVTVILAGHVYTPDDPAPSGCSIDEPKIQFHA